MLFGKTTQTDNAPCCITADSGGEGSTLRLLLEGAVTEYMSFNLGAAGCWKRAGRQHRKAHTQREREI